VLHLLSHAIERRCALAKIVFYILNIVSMVVLLSALLNFQTSGLKVCRKWRRSLGRALAK